MSTKQENKNERKKNVRPPYIISPSNSFLPPPKERKQQESPPAETKKATANTVVVLQREFIVCNKDEAAIRLLVTNIECRTALVFESKYHIALAHIDSLKVDVMIKRIVERFKKGKKKPIVATIIGGRDNAMSKEYRLSITQALQSHNISPKEHLSDQNVFKTDGLLFMGLISLAILRMSSNIFDYTPSYGIVKTEHVLLAVLIVAAINRLYTPYGLTVEIDTSRAECLSIRPTSREDSSLLSQYVNPEQMGTATIASRLHSFLPGNQGNYREIDPQTILNTNLSPTGTEETPPLTEEDRQVEELCGL